jgi:hypothetical protein
MKTADNVYQSITVWEEGNAKIEICGSGSICVEDYNSGHEVYMRIDSAQMKAISAFLLKASKGIMDGIGNPEGGAS